MNVAPPFRAQGKDATDRPSPAGRSGRFDLSFVRHGPRTVLGEQFVSYPFHMTRPFYLDSAIPSLLTVYQQSSSGGLYRDDRSSCRYRLGAQASAHVTTQAAAIVHDCRGEPARQHVEIELAEGAFLALTPDPLVLFPGASCKFSVSARLGVGAVLLLSDSFAAHDPAGRARPFDRIASSTSISGAQDKLLMRENFDLSGQDFLSAASPMGHWRDMCTMLVLGEASRLPLAADLSARLEGKDAVAAASRLPNGSGFAIRCLAASADARRGIAEAIFTEVVKAALGTAPARRPK